MADIKEKSEKNVEQEVTNRNQNGEQKNIEKGKANEGSQEKSIMSKRIGFLMGFGAAFVVLGAVMVIFWPSIFFSQLKRMMILTDKSQSFEMWREVPIPMYLECFFFNITNVADILAGKNVKITVEEVGPYVFRETHTKTNLTWNNNATVTYYNQKWWHYQPDMSNGSLSDSITSINPIIATVAYTVRNRARVIRLAADVMMRMFHEHTFITANVSSWLFDGIDDPIIDVANKIPDFPLKIPFDKFGWFYERNGSLEYDGVFLMNTGSEDFSRLGNIEKWHYSNRTMYRDECGEVRGSTGELWAPELGQPNVVVFVPDICTYLTLNANGSVEVQGIKGAQYAADDSLLDNGYTYPDKECYCDLPRNADCLPPGALNVSACRYGAPAFVSLPHMLLSDPYYPSKIDGLHPKPEHNFKLSLEMYTGMPLSVAAQLQINLLVRHVPLISLNNQLPDEEVLVPMFWFRQELFMTEEYARLARTALNLRDMMPYAFYALTVLGIVLALIGIVILLRKILKSEDTTPILNQTEQEEESEEQR